jgi:hypothetical protein
MEADENVSGLSVAQVKFLSALLCARSVMAAVAESGVPESTAMRWLRDAAFRRELDARKQAILDATAARVQHLMLEAASTLEEVMTNPRAPSSARVAAAGKVLDHGYRLLELELVVKEVRRLKDVVEQPSANGLHPRLSR